MMVVTRSLLLRGVAGVAMVGLGSRVVRVVTVARAVRVWPVQPDRVA